MPESGNWRVCSDSVRVSVFSHTPILLSDSKPAAPNHQTTSPSHKRIRPFLMCWHRASTRIFTISSVRRTPSLCTQYPLDGEFRPLLHARARIHTRSSHSNAPGPAALRPDSNAHTRMYDRAQLHMQEYIHNNPQSRPGASTPPPRATTSAATPSSRPPPPAPAPRRPSTP